MYTEAIGGITAIRLANFYKYNQSNIKENMERIASGKRFQSPGIHAADYFRASNFKNDVRGLQAIDREITGAVGMLTVAEQVGTSVFEDLLRMKELVKQYYNGSTSDEEKTVLMIEFNTTKRRIADTIDSTQYDNKKLIADNGATPLSQISIDPRNVTETFDISYNAGDVADVGILNLGATDLATELAAVETEYGKAASYLIKTTVYSDSLTAFHVMNSKKKVTYEKSIEETENIDTGKEYMELTKKQIAQQMTVSMMAQASMVRSSVLSLLNVGK